MDYFTSPKVSTWDARYAAKKASASAYRSKRDADQERRAGFAPGQINALCTLLTKYGQES